MKIIPPKFPLSSPAFAASLKTGHGRAIQHVRRFGSNGLEKQIIDACLFSLTYDPQCEAKRAPWLFSLVERAGLTEQILHAIQAAPELMRDEDSHDLDQRFALLKAFAAAGIDNARHMLYASFGRLSASSELLGAEHIVALDGKEGLLHVARQFGLWMQTDPDFKLDCDFIDYCDEWSDTSERMAVLENAALTDNHVAIYLAAIRKQHSQSKDRSKSLAYTEHSGLEIINLVKKNPQNQCHWFRRWGIKTAHAEREKVFAALLESDEPEHVKRWFRCFSEVGLPVYEKSLLRWISHADRQVQLAAIKAFAPLTHSDLRQIAMQLMGCGDMAGALLLLLNNFEAGDYVLCMAHLTPCDNEAEVHLLVGQMLELCDRHPGADALPFLLYVYEYSPCSYCRHLSVKSMCQMKIMPAWIKEEILFDTDPDTRNLGIEW